MNHIALFAAGGIGRRHMQACAALDKQDYCIHVIEPSEENRQLAMQMWEQTINSNITPAPDINFYSDIDELPINVISIAIVATQASIRLAVVKQILESKQVSYMLLEKILFQRIEEYESCQLLLDKYNVKAWVNCSRRMWPAYQDLKKKYCDQIKSCDVSGNDWDIGCNGVHFLDLFAYLTNTDEMNIHDIDLEPPPIPAKREGMLHVQGCFRGILHRHDMEIPFLLSSATGHLSGFLITLELKNGDVLCIREKGSEMVVDYSTNDGEKSGETYETPFQSGLTNVFIESVTNKGYSELALYSKTRKLHECFISRLTSTLNQYNPDVQLDYCPVT